MRRWCAPIPRGDRMSAHAGRLPELFGPGVDCRVVLVDQMERDASGKRLVVKTLAARDESARGSAR